MSRSCSVFVTEKFNCSTTSINARLGTILASMVRIERRQIQEITSHYHQTQQSTIWSHRYVIDFYISHPHFNKNHSLNKKTCLFCEDLKHRWQHFVVCHLRINGRCLWYEIASVYRWADRKPMHITSRLSRHCNCFQTGKSVDSRISMLFSLS